MITFLAKTIYWLFAGLALMSLVPLAYVLTHPEVELRVWVFSYAAVGSALWILGRSFREMLTH